MFDFIIHFTIGGILVLRILLPVIVLTKVIYVLSLCGRKRMKLLDGHN